MLDIGWTEMAFIAVIALVVIGPKDLPKALRTVSHYVRKARSMAREFQSGLDDIARETELDEVKDQITGGLDFDLNDEIEKTIDPAGEIDDALDISDELDALDADTPEVSHDLPEPPGSDFVPPAEDEAEEPDGAEAADEPAEKADEPAEKADEPAEKADEPAEKADEPAATESDDPAERKQEASV